MIPVLLLVTATFRPAAPTVGDPITIRFEKAVRLDASPSYEIVSQQGNTAVIRSFDPKPFAISGRTGDVAFRNMVVPMQSVLKPHDDLKPAPLKPPIKEPYPRMPFVLIAVAALAAIAAWTAAALRRERAIAPVVSVIPPDERFRAAVAGLGERTPMRWARLADAVREYLAATTEFGSELTTSELLLRAAAWPPHSIVAEILWQGDLEKFSPWGAMPGDFAAVANRALQLIPEPLQEQAA